MKDGLLWRMVYVIAATLFEYVGMAIFSIEQIVILRIVLRICERIVL